MESPENQLHPNTNRKEGFSLRKSSTIVKCEVLTVHRKVHWVNKCNRNPLSMLVTCTHFIHWSPIT